MLRKFLEEVVEIIVGKQAEPIAELLESNKHVNEFIIAKKLDITINQTRNILYKLSDFGLVSSIRKKDKRKGWYTYFWRIESLKALEFLKEELVKRKTQIENQVKSRETKEFYVCERCKIELNAENALVQDFTCNECGEIMDLKDNTKLLKDFKRILDRINKKLKLVQVEVDIQIGKLDKKKEREAKKEAAEKAVKRAKSKKKAAKTRAINKAAKEKENRGKKKIAKKKKKPVKKTKKKVKKSKRGKKVAKKKPVKKKMRSKKK
jgi:transcription factor E